MEYLTYIIVGLIPAASLTVVVYIFLKKNNERQLTQISLNSKKERQKYFLEPRMDAYQRFILLLERITPSNLTMRLYDDKKTATSFHQEILTNIRQEFDHNVAQQLFISVQAWDLIKKSKEESIKIINVSAQQLDKEATATDLSTKIFEIISELKEQPTEIAIRLLKKEFQQLF